MEKTKITPTKSGPLMIEGDLSVYQENGDLIKEGKKFFLCRCGQSSHKPFCDGTHKKVEFKAE